MSKEELKRISLDITEDCWAELQIFALKKRMKTYPAIKLILENFTDKKRNSSKESTEE